MTPIHQGEQTSGCWVWLLPLVALLLSATCVTSSTFLALSLWPTEISQAQMLAESEASYERDLLPVKFAPLDPQIIFAATRDSLGLQLTPSSGSVNPPVAEIPAQLFPPAKATTGRLPTAVVIMVTLTPRPPSQPTSEPDRPTPRATITPQPTATGVPATATMTLPPTLPASPLPTKTATVMATAVPATVTPSSMPSPVPTQPSTATPPAPTRTPPALPPPATATATTSATFTPLPTNTPTPPPTQTPTPTDTPTSTPTHTPVVPPCTGYIPGGEPNIGLPNGTVAQIGCGESLVVDLGAVKAIVVAGGVEPDYDLIFFELENPATTVNLDWVIVEVGTSASGPWYPVFYWGDGIVDTNSNIGQLGYGLGGEPDNQPIPFADLYGGNSAGVAIDLDAVVPAGSYQWVRFTAPLGGANDAAEIDSVDALP